MGIAICFQKIALELRRERDIAPLALLRIALGLLWAFAMLRNIYKGWIYDFYLAPDFFFHFYGFSWLSPLPAPALYALVFALVFAALGIALGYYYRFCSWFFFLGFSYLELLDLTHYLNHYYLLMLLVFLLACLPAHRAWSLDVYFGRVAKTTKIEAWQLWIIAWQIGLVYFHAALAKLNSDWLLLAQPMRFWLQEYGQWPILGSLLAAKQTAYFFSYFGFFYDLLIPFALLWSKSRPLAFFAVLSFHILTALLFPIGIFPWMMIILASFFFSAQWHKEILRRFAAVFILTLSKLKLAQKKASKPSPQTASPERILFFLLYAAWQSLWPLRHICYGGDVLWDEQGFRFSWRVMLVEKSGSVSFRLRDLASGREALVLPSSYLSPKQELMMLMQPDLIVQFAKHIGQEYQSKHAYSEPAVYADVFVSLNGRPSARLIDPTRNLLDLSPSPWRAWSGDWVLASPRRR